MTRHLRLVAGIPADTIHDTGVYLRLSVTNRCQFRCAYCRPGKLAIETRADEALAHEELLELVQHLAGAVPIRKVRLTGGEPLLDRHLEHLIAQLRRQIPDAELCLTTNGALLARRAGSLREAGLDRINVSLDTLAPGRFQQLTGGSDLDTVLAGIDAAHAAGFSTLRINSVLLRHVNGDQLPSLVRTARDLGCEPRLIELMPFGQANTLFRDEFLPAAEALARLGETFTYLGALGRTGTAEQHLFADGDARVQVGLISSVSQPFCAGCDRLRLDSRGHLHACLRGQCSVDLASPLRSGRCGEVARRIERLLASKPGLASSWPPVDMSAIGG